MDLKNGSIKCDVCGKFVSPDDLYPWGDAYREFTPDTHFTSERYDTVCGACARKEKAWAEEFALAAPATKPKPKEATPGPIAR